MTDVSDPQFDCCPSCGRAVVENAVLCIECGFHLEKGIHLAPVVVEPAVENFPARDENPSDSNPYRPPASATETAPEQGSRLLAFLSIFWINGRIPRWQWWAYVVGSPVAGLLVMGINELIYIYWNYESPLPVLAFFFFYWVPIAAQVKRWHDIDRSGLWFIVNFIPIIGPLYTLVECGFERGTKGPNDYGEDPLEGRSTTT